MPTLRIKRNAVIASNMGGPKECSSKQLRWLHSQNDSLVAPTFSACLVILSNGLDLAFIAPSVRQMIACIWSNPRSFRVAIRLFIDDPQRLFKRFHLVFQFGMHF